jgi:prepilin-type N-terminal cleavage/methylation domain-containing protein
MKKNVNSNQGFTLVELLISIIVLVVIGSVITGIISSSLRGSSKANNIEKIRQAGNYALNQITKGITYTQAFNKQATGLSNDYNVTPPDLPYPSVCSSSPGTQYKYITVQSTSSILTRYNCDDSTLTVATKQNVAGSTFTDPPDNLVDASSFALTGCNFTCIQAENEVPIINIKFKIGPKNPSGLAEDNISSEVTFETSVTMRNR